MDDALTRFLALWRDPAVDAIEARTSGSTGAPKRILLPKALMERSARRTNAFFGIGPGSLLACPLSLDYIAARMMAVRAEVAGCPLHLLDPSNSPFGAYRPGRPVTLLAVVPSQLEALARWTGRALHIIVGGAPMTAAQEALARSLAPARVYATYGMTETASHIALRDVTAGDDRYRALPGVSLAVDGRGCLVVDGMATNDMVRLTAPDSFLWLGRADNVVNSGGIKLHPEALERTLVQAEPALDGRFYLTGRPSARWGSELVAVAADAAAAALLARAVAAALPATHRPKEVFVRPMARTPNGKLRRERPEG